MISGMLNELYFLLRHESKEESLGKYQVVDKIRKLIFKGKIEGVKKPTCYKYFRVNVLKGGGYC